MATYRIKATYEYEGEIEANIEEDKSQETYYWSDLANLTHKTQVENFGWCSCEDNEGNENPYSDCP